eukprot:Skav221123  [mRNA]  locus=scaffold233:433456:443491:- [translate_table: standard]
MRAPLEPKEVAVLVWMGPDHVMTRGIPWVPVGLTDCQRKALAGVRAHSTESHEQALAKVKTTFQSLGFVGRELETTLGWIQDMAPVVIHVNLDRMGHFMETDEFYRNQFETKTSNGALDPENNTRKNLGSFRSLQCTVLLPEAQHILG